MEPKAPSPLSLPAGTEVRSVTAKGLTLIVPEAVSAGSTLEFDLLLGARPLAVLARATQCRVRDARYAVEVEFLAMAQVDRDALADFLTAVGAAAVRVRPHQEDR